MEVIFRHADYFPLASMLASWMLGFLDLFKELMRIVLTDPERL